MGCTGTKASKAEGDLERYHQAIFAAAQTGDVKSLKDILDELDRRKASTTKKEVLNMGMKFFLFPRFCLLFFASLFHTNHPHRV
jgi:hypothetical protein